MTNAKDIIDAANKYVQGRSHTVDNVLDSFFSMLRFRKKRALDGSVMRKKIDATSIQGCSSPKWAKKGN